MRGGLLVRWALPWTLALAFAAPAAAQDDASTGDDAGDDDSGSAPYGLGPLEVSPLPLLGNVGAPRSAVPETRFGFLLHWMMQSGGGGDGHLLGLVLEAHLELFDTLEVGVDVEALQYAKINFPATSTTSDQDYADFGFITPRLKYAFVNGDMVTVSAGLGVMLPTSSAPPYAGVTPLAFDPGLYFGLRLLDIISINASVPVVLQITIPDAGDNSLDVHIVPTAGIAVMPVDFIGGFADCQFDIWADADGNLGQKVFNGMNVVVGARSKFLPWMMGEIGAIIPVAGDAANRFDFGMGIRLVATPDFL